MFDIDMKSGMLYTLNRNIEFIRKYEISSILNTVLK